MSLAVSSNGGRLALRASVAILAAAGIALAVGWADTQHTRTALYQPPGEVSRIELDLASGSVDVVGSRGSAVQVQRIDRFAFGHPARERRALAGGVLRVSSRCPRILVGSCSSSYRLTVPDDVAVVVRTTAGHIRLDGFRGSARIQSASGEVRVDAFCGFDLSAASGSGDVTVVSACAPETLDLRTTSGNATAVVPPGRYRVTASSASGERRVRGVIPSDQTPLSIAVRSTSGDVTVAGGL
jgi:hypothetical protein